MSTSCPYDDVSLSAFGQLAVSAVWQSFERYFLLQDHGDSVKLLEEAPGVGGPDLGRQPGHAQCQEGEAGAGGLP